MDNLPEQFPGTLSLSTKEEWFKLNGKVYVKYTYPNNRTTLEESPYKEIPVLLLENSIPIPLEYYAEYAQKIAEETVKEVINK